MSNKCLPESPVKRPILPYFGGKWRIAPWVVSHFPPHRTYVEPFGGAASCLLRKSRAEIEIYNDLNDEVVELFRVLRDEASAARLIELLTLTPYSRTEYLEAYEPTDDLLERVRRTFVKFHGAFGSNCQEEGRRKASFKTGRDGKDAPAWTNFPPHLTEIVHRLRGVLVENRDAIEILRKYDSPETLAFVDPPYVTATRTSQQVYRHELDNDAHERLAETIHSLKGMVILAGYPSPLYDRLYPGWQVVTTQNKTCGNSYRTEALWLSPRTQEQLHVQREKPPTA